MHHDPASPLAHHGDSFCLCHPRPEAHHVSRATRMRQVHRAASLSLQTLRGPSIRALQPLSSRAMSSSSKPYEAYPAGKTKEQWQAELDPKYFPIWANALTGGTQRPFVGHLDDFFTSEGHFACAACAAPLYAPGHKFDHPCGWCSFNQNIDGAVGVRLDANDPARGIHPSRDEVFCEHCGGHLGHRFPHGRGWRDCVNSICLVWKKESADGAAAAAK